MGLANKKLSELTPEQAARRRRQYADSTMRRYRLNREIVDKFLSQPCVDCDTAYPPEIMCCDHVRGTKEFTISRKLATYNSIRIKAELEKCDPRCPTYHALRHFLEGTFKQAR